MALHRILAATTTWGFKGTLQDKGKISDTSSRSSSSESDEEAARRVPLLATDSRASVLSLGYIPRRSYGATESRSAAESSHGASSRTQSPEAYRRSGSLPNVPEEESFNDLTGDEEQLDDLLEDRGLYVGTYVLQLPNVLDLDGAP